MTTLQNSFTEFINSLPEGDRAAAEKCFQRYMDWVSGRMLGGYQAVTRLAKNTQQTSVEFYRGGKRVVREEIDSGLYQESIYAPNGELIAQSRSSL